MTKKPGWIIAVVILLALGVLIARTFMKGTGAIRYKPAASSHAR